MSENIDKLLDKYFEGETSLEEERMLRTLFQDEAVRQKYALYAPMFAYFEQEKEKIKTEKPGSNMEKEPAKRRHLPLWVLVAACLIGIVLLTKVVVSNLNIHSSEQSLVYIDGEKTVNMEVISSQALNSINSIDSFDEDIINSQVDILDTFAD